MADGIKVYNEDGSLQFDTTSRLFRTLTISDTSTAGSVTIPGASSQGTVLASVTPINDSDTAGPPNATVSGDTVSWTSGVRSNINIMVF
jgi:hypothetical protein